MGKSRQRPAPLFGRMGMGHPIVCFLRNKPNFLVVRAFCKVLHDNRFSWRLCRFVTWVCFAGLALFWGCGVVFGGVLMRITGLVIAGGEVNASGRTLTLTLSLREGRGENCGRALTWTLSVQEGRGENCGRALTWTVSVQEGRGENCGRALTWTLPFKKGEGEESGRTLALIAPPREGRGRNCSVCLRVRIRMKGFRAARKLGAAAPHAAWLPCRSWCW